MNSITFLNFSGDVTITWTKESEKQVLALIEKKMKEGVSFFITKSGPFGLFSRDVKASSVKEIKKAGNARLTDAQVRQMTQSIDDGDVAALVGTGHAQLSKPGASKGTSDAIRARTAQEVVQAKQSVAVRPLAGG